MPIASGKWVGLVPGIPGHLQMFHVILVVTSQHPGEGVVLMYTFIVKWKPSEGRGHYITNPNTTLLKGNPYWGRETMDLYVDNNIPVNIVIFNIKNEVDMDLG